MSAQALDYVVDSAKENLLALAYSHDCATHPLFAALEERHLEEHQVAALLRNYDAHASVLRRLLLKAATIMPESAVGYVLENVRNEYGNGDYAGNHQAQLQDVAWQSGVKPEAYKKARIEPAVKSFIKAVGKFYTGADCGSESGLLRPAIAAGAITATELLAVKEFRALQLAFSRFGLEHHIWFHHVTIEEEHSDESLALALHFIEHNHAYGSVVHGMNGVLQANLSLYDGLLATLA